MSTPPVPSPVPAGTEGDGHDERCDDLTRSMRGYLRCTEPLGHEGSHMIVPAGPHYRLAAVVSSSPATPEHNHGAHSVKAMGCPACDAHYRAPSTLPAETREGRCPGALNVKGEHYACDNQYPHDGWACTNGYLGALWQGTAASPAVSLPGEEKKP